MKKFELNYFEKLEIEKLKEELNEHIKKYTQFKSFTAVAKDALQVADALINGDYATFKKYQLKYTKHTAQKMEGMQSLSTYKKTSYICKWLSQHDGICKHCYAEKSLKLYETSLKPVLIYNTLLLKYIDITSDNIPYINNKYFRFESFSDLQSSKHLSNLIKVCKKNKNTIFTLWTKTDYHFTSLMAKENIKKLPSNLNIVISEFNLNKAQSIDFMNSLQTCFYPSQAVTGKYTNALKYFIVYDSEEKRKASGFYQCKNNCLNCLKCYKKSKKIIYIAELLH